MSSVVHFIAMPGDDFVIRSVLLARLIIGYAILTIAGGIVPKGI